MTELNSLENLDDKALYWVMHCVRFYQRNGASNGNRSFKQMIKEHPELVDEEKYEQLLDKVSDEVDF